MKIILHRWLLLISLSSTFAAKDAELPLCPTDVQYFPQSLPMHCRMPANSGTPPQSPQSFYQSPAPDLLPPPVPIPVPPFPGMPGAMPMPGGMQMPGMMGGPMPGPMGMPMPMPMMGGPSHKLPVIVMPFYSPDKSFKKPHKKKPRRKIKKSSESETDSSSDKTSSEGGTSDGSDEHGFWKDRRKERRKTSRRFNIRHKSRKKERKSMKKDLLTPILQYVTKDGYVIFEKTISNSEAKNWLGPKNEVNMVEEVDHKQIGMATQKSAEEPHGEQEPPREPRGPPREPRGPPRESLRERESHRHEISLNLAKTETSTNKVHMKKRPRRINNLINKLDQQP